MQTTLTKSLLVLCLESTELCNLKPEINQKIFILNVVNLYKDDANAFPAKDGAARGLENSLFSKIASVTHRAGAFATITYIAGHLVHSGFEGNFNIYSPPKYLNTVQIAINQIKIPLKMSDMT